jgi:AcrR family transcriptional regulator
MSRSVRHDALLDAVVELVTTGDVEDVSMETVAERAGVSRPLVYKHFANRGELLAAAYRREATALHGELTAEVAAAGTLIDMYRTLVGGALRAAGDRRDGVFAALRSAGARNRELRQEQRLRDVETVRAFSAQAVREYRLDRREATAATVLLLGAIEPLVAQWRLRPTPENAALLEETFIRMVDGGYALKSHSCD